MIKNLDDKSRKSGFWFWLHLSFTIYRLSTSLTSTSMKLTDTSLPYPPLSICDNQKKHIIITLPHPVALDFSIWINPHRVNSSGNTHALLHKSIKEGIGVEGEENSWQVSTPPSIPFLLGNDSQSELPWLYIGYEPLRDEGLWRGRKLEA